MYGRLDYAFNNAGVVEDPASFANKTSSIFDKIMAINVKGVYLSMKHEIHQMLKNGGRRQAAKERNDKQQTEIMTNVTKKEISAGKDHWTWSIYTLPIKN